MTRTRAPFDDIDTADVLGLGIHLRASTFDKTIARYGSPGVLWPAVTCPCANPAEGSRDPTCPNCAGQGVLYPPERWQRTRALDTQRNATVQLIAAGQLPEGSIRITFPTAVIPSKGDLWLPDLEEHVVDEVLSVRQPIPRERLSMWEKTTDTEPAVDIPARARLKYPKVLAVEVVTWRDPVTKAICYASEGDYTIAPNGDWTWLRGGPGPGASWSVRYRAPAAYRLHTELPRYRAEGGKRMPHACTGRRLDRIGDDHLPEAA